MHEEEPRQMNVRFIYPNVQRGNERETKTGPAKYAKESRLIEKGKQNVNNTKLKNHVKIYLKSL